MTTLTWALIVTAGIAALSHGLAPDHWLPYVLTAKARQMSPARAMAMSISGAVSHLVTTIVLGLLFSLAGEHLAKGAAAGLQKVISLMVIAMGIYFLWRGATHYWNPEAEEHHCLGHPPERVNSSDCVIGAALGIRACPEAIPIFLAISTRGVFTSLVAVLVYVVLAIGSLIGMVMFSIYSLKVIRLPWLERHGELLSGALIVVVGLIILLIKE